MNDSSSSRLSSTAPGQGPITLVAAGAIAAVLLNLLLLYDLLTFLVGHHRAIVGDIVDTWEPSCWATLVLFVIFAVLAFLLAALRLISQGGSRRLANLSLVLCASGVLLALASHATTSYVVWGRFKLW